MLEFLDQAIGGGPAVTPWDMLFRLLAAFAFGGLVAWIYRRTRKDTDISPSFTRTLVLLAILIAMVTQVIGDNVARAFSLVGALSIVRFRTVVRDTQDTAYVIFSVVVGMAVGASHLLVALAGVGVVGLAAFMMTPRAAVHPVSPGGFSMSLRISIGQDLNELLGKTLDSYVSDKLLMSISTAKQGASLDVTYQVWLRDDGSVDELVKSLNRTEGVQSVQLERRGEAES